MPGIFGFMSYNGGGPGTNLRPMMLDDLCHQEWYGTGVADFRGGFGGAVSTSPFFSADDNIYEDDRILLIIEGNAITVGDSLCNFPENRAAKKIVDKYLRLGPEFIESVSGNFNLLLLDKKKNTLNIYNDRLGFSYLYYYFGDDYFIFSSEIKAILNHPAVDRSIDLSAVSSFFTSNTIIGNDTFFRRIKLLPPASILSVSSAGTSLASRWKPEPRPFQDRTNDGWIDRALELYGRSLAKRLPEDKNSKIIFPLTGGLDSRLQLELTRKSYPNIQLFTHGESRSSDYRIAKKVAGALNLSERHELVTISPDWMADYAYRTIWLNEGQVNFRSAYLVGVANALGPGKTTFVNGIIGAHMSTGAQSFFTRDELIPVSSSLDKRKLINSLLGAKGSHAFFHLYLKDEICAELKERSIENGLEKFEDFSHIELLGDRKDIFLNYNIGRRMMGNTDLNKFYFYDILPLVDEELFDMYLSIPSELKIGHSLYQDIFRKKFAHLAKIIWADLGSDLYSKPKSGWHKKLKKLKHQGRHYLSRAASGKVYLKDHSEYVHRSHWLRTNKKIRDLYFENIRYARDNDIGIVDPDKILNLMEDHDRGRDYLYDPLAKAISFIIWHRLFVYEERTLV
jgi:asparagine synthetase B (glutamine-hydrolysing)